MATPEAVQAPAPAQATAVPGPDDIQPTSHETLDRTLTGLVAGEELVQLTAFADDDAPGAVAHGRIRRPSRRR